MKLGQMFSTSLFLSAVVTTTACDPHDPGGVGGTQGETDQDLRDNNRFEAVADFNEVANSLRALYGPLVRKQARYHFDLDDLIADTRQALRDSHNDSDTARAIQRFLDVLRDGHVSYSPSVLSDSARQVAIPLLVAPVESKFLVNAIGGTLQGKVAIGDELISIDGRTPCDLIHQFGRYEGVPNAKTEAQLAASLITFRSFFLPPQFLPAPGSAASLRFARANGSTYEISTAWLSNRPPPRLSPPPSKGAALLRPYALASSSFQDVLHQQPERTAYADISRNRPFFLTSAVQTTFAITPVRPSNATLTAFQVPACDGATASTTFDCYQSFAGTYNYKGKRVLLVRIPSYVPSTAAGSAFDSTYVKALFKDFQASTDVLVIDETNNPGGSVATATDILGALLTQPAINAGFALHADRKSVNDLRASAEQIAAQGPDFAGLAAKFQTAADATELAYDRHEPLGPPVAFIQFDPTGADDRIPPDAQVQWTKPFVVLTNELSFSGGDLFPMLIKANHLATLFGETTAGLGGNVEDVLTTSFSQGSLAVTRSLYAPLTQTAQIPFGTLVEDQGVTPDVVHPITVSDFRAGLVGYVTAFSEVAVHAVR